MSLENKIVALAEVIGTDVRDLRDGKVDKVDGKGLPDENYTLIEKTKLAGIEPEATANRADSANADKVHTHTTAQVTGLDTALGSKVDKVAGKGLSDTNFTQAEKTKLSSLESSKFVGLFVSEGALPATGSAGDYANVDGGVGSDVYRVIWDTSDNKWARVQGVSTDLTDAQIKQQYENNPDTNAFTDTEKSKLAGVATAATANRADSLNADKTHTHTTAQVTGLDTALESKASKTELTDGLALKVDKVAGKGLSDTNFTQVEKTKLTGIATGATNNRADTLNADKVHTHTTAQVTGLDTALEGKVSKTELTTGLGLKVDKVAGKGLSDTNFTQVEKTKLADVGDITRDFVDDYLLARGE